MIDKRVGVFVALRAQEEVELERLEVVLEMREESEACVAVVVAAFAWSLGCLMFVRKSFDGGNRRSLLYARGGRELRNQSSLNAW